MLAAESAFAADAALGTATGDLAPLADRTPFDGWLALDSDDADAPPPGALHVIARWVHNPVLHFAPFEANPRENLKKAPNELCVAVVRARGCDKNNTELGPPTISSEPHISFKTRSFRLILGPVIISTRDLEIWPIPLAKSVRIEPC